MVLHLRLYPTVYLSLLLQVDFLRTSNFLPLALLEASHLRRHTTNKDHQVVLLLPPVQARVKPKVLLRGSTPLQDPMIADGKDQISHRVRAQILPAGVNHPV